MVLSVARRDIGYWDNFLDFHLYCVSRGKGLRYTCSISSRAINEIFIKGEPMKSAKTADDAGCGYVSIVVFVVSKWFYEPDIII